MSDFLIFQPHYKIPELCLIFTVKTRGVVVV
uniref:Uncharacterized protein n=1 Tax=Anguilla anguilla TaxID=7936 RepID=A0A0E9UE19_ANGAN